MDAQRCCIRIYLKLPILVFNSGIPFPLLAHTWVITSLAYAVCIKRTNSCTCELDSFQCYLHCTQQNDKQRCAPKATSINKFGVQTNAYLWPHIWISSGSISLWESEQARWVGEIRPFALRIYSGPTRCLPFVFENDYGYSFADSWILAKYSSILQKRTSQALRAFTHFHPLSSLYTNNSYTRFNYNRWIV